MLLVKGLVQYGVLHFGFEPRNAEPCMSPKENASVHCSRGCVCHIQSTTDGGVGDGFTLLDEFVFPGLILIREVLEQSLTHHNELCRT